MNGISRSKLGFVLMALMTLLTCVVLAIQPPIAQPSEYHQFAGELRIFGVANFWNVASNIAFSIFGCIGLYKLHISKSLTVLDGGRVAYSLLFFGVALVGLGSGYYHLSPDNSTLVWDRLPMTIAFMALFAIIISEYVSEHWGWRLLWPLLGLGASSVVYWHYTESQGQGDLRLYALIQFLPMLLIPIILLCFDSVYNKSSGYWYLLVAYIAAKLLEHFDSQVYAFLGVMSGHPLKHLAAAIGIYMLMYAYQRRVYR